MKLPRLKLVKLKVGEKSNFARRLRFIMVLNILVSAVAFYNVPRVKTYQEIQDQEEIEKESEILSQ